VVDPTSFSAPDVGDVWQFDGTKHVMAPFALPVPFVVNTFGFSPSRPLVARVGTVIATPAFSASYSALPTAATLSSSVHGLVATLASPYNSAVDPNTYTPDGTWPPTTPSIIWTLAATKGAASASRTTSVSFAADIVWGVQADPGFYDQAFIDALPAQPSGGSALQLGRGIQIDPLVCTAPGAYIFFVLAASLGDPTFVLSPSGSPGILPGGMTKVASNVTRNIVVGPITTPVPCNVWRTSYASIGTTRLVSA
jgi:hypothetical protein